MKILATIICSFTVIFCAVAANPTMKPKLLVAADGFPKGHDTPEGAACDLARAFIKHDDALFTTTCIRLYGGGKARADYAAFLAKTVAEIKTEAARKEPSPGGPKSIGKMFAARHLSKDGPASYGYAAFGFQERHVRGCWSFPPGRGSLPQSNTCNKRQGRQVVCPPDSKCLPALERRPQRRAAIEAGLF